MMRMKKMIVVLGLFVVVALGLSPKPAAADVISDTFTGTAGTLLNGRAVEVGGVAWTQYGVGVLDYLALSSTGTVTSNNTSTGGPFAVVPLTASLLASDTISVEADIDPTSTTGIRVGFTGDISGSYWAAQQIDILVRNSGYYAVVIPTDRLLVTGYISSYQIDTLYNVKLSYTASANSVSAWVDGVQVLDNYDLTANQSYTPNISQAGFLVSQPSIIDGPDVDNFSVVPEPATMVLLGLGGVGLLVRRRRRV